MQGRKLSDYSLSEWKPFQSCLSFFFKSFWSCSENLKRPFILAIIKMGSEILSIEASVLALKNHSSIFHWISINGHELFGAVNKLRNFVLRLLILKTQIKSSLKIKKSSYFRYGKKNHEPKCLANIF